ncbi:MAG: hypothetical protein QM733_00970 [Ilumatobacteraceae bacterium]
MYDSNVLFPVLSNWLMPRDRPDYGRLVEQLDLTTQADPFEVLARCEGIRATDRVERVEAGVPGGEPNRQLVVAAERVAEQLQIVEDPGGCGVAGQLAAGNLVGESDDFNPDPDTFPTVSCCGVSSLRATSSAAPVSVSSAPPRCCAARREVPARAARRRGCRCGRGPVCTGRASRSFSRATLRSGPAAARSDVYRVICRPWPVRPR